MKPFCVHAFTTLLLTICICACGKGGIDVKPKPGEETKPDKPTEKHYETWEDATGVDGAVYICNGKIQLGVDPARGGTIFHFSESGTKKNLVNHYDEGREIQQSYYGWADGSKWNGQDWVWNPVQGGSWNGVKGKILSKAYTDTSVIIRSTPVLWASAEMANDCVMQETIILKDMVAHVKFSFIYSGTMTGTNRHQELPAFFVDWSLQNFVWYDGTSPWTGGKLSSYVPARLDQTNKNEYKGNDSSSHFLEKWAAYVDDSGWGIGIYSPSATMCTLYRYGAGPGGPKAASCSYLAPIAALKITPGWQFSYDVYFTIGTQEEIRERFQKAFKKQL